MDKTDKYEAFLITLSQWVAGNEQIDTVFKEIREKE